MFACLHGDGRLDDETSSYLSPTSNLLFTTAPAFTLWPPRPPGFTNMATPVNDISSQVAMTAVCGAGSSQNIGSAVFAGVEYFPCRGVKGRMAASVLVFFYLVQYDVRWKPRIKVIGIFVQLISGRFKCDLPLLVRVQLIFGGNSRD